MKKLWMRVRVICSLRLLGCFSRVQTSADPEIHRSRAEALRLKRVTRLESLGTSSCPVSGHETAAWELLVGPGRALASSDWDRGFLGERRGAGRFCAMGC